MIRFKGVNGSRDLLRPGGRIALGQSSLLRTCTLHGTRDSSGVTTRPCVSITAIVILDERDLTSVRALVGVLRRANLQNVTARTVLIERVSPVDAATESLSAGCNI